MHWLGLSVQARARDNGQSQHTCLICRLSLLLHSARARARCFRHVERTHVLIKTLTVRCLQPSRQPLAHQAPWASSRATASVPSSPRRNPCACPRWASGTRPPETSRTVPRMPCASTGPCKAAARPLHCRASTRASLCAMLAGTGANNKEPRTRCSCHLAGHVPGNPCASRPVLRCARHMGGAEEEEAVDCTRTWLRLRAEGGAGKSERGTRRRRRRRSQSDQSPS